MKTTHKINIRYLIILIAVAMLACVVSLEGVYSQDTAEKPKKEDLAPDIYGRYDPFAPIGMDYNGSSANKMLGLTLEGVITGSTKPLAIINNTIVKETDIIEGKKIKKIQTDRITIEDENGKEHELKLFKEEDK
ncbi:MAG: hypothetical protein V2A72_01245 [Candidatus Omnitrophota bacterium]